MPTYDYRCKACGQELEVFQSFSDDALTTCEACGGELRKLFGAPGIAFKGSGFYKNDSRGGSKKSTVDRAAADKARRRQGELDARADKSSSRHVELEQRVGRPKKEPAGQLAVEERRLLDLTSRPYRRAAGHR